VKAYVVRRLLLFVPTLVAVSVVVFAFIHFVPGNPAAMIVGADASPEAEARVAEALGLNEPIHVQYFTWAGRALQGDLGRSYMLDAEVTTLILSRLPVTGSLTVMAFFIALLIGLPAGIVAAIRQGSWIDNSVMFGALLGLSVPNFWLGLNLIILFAVVLGWLPSGGYVNWSDDPIAAFKSLLMPAFALGFSAAAVIARMTRSTVLEVMRLDYIQTARSKGVAERFVIIRHALRNAMIPIVTVLGVVVGSLLNGSVVTETVFTIPGIGRLVVSAVARRDFPVLQGGILFVTVVYLTVNLIVDIIYTWIDPRIRYT
jgi:peptide/nickel transport system permease protein